MVDSAPQVLNKANSTLDFVNKALADINEKGVLLQEKAVLAEALLSKALETLDLLDASEQRILGLLEKRIKSLEAEKAANDESIS